MKRLIIVCAGLMVAGCDSSNQQQAEMNAKIQDLEKRVARIEGDLYKFEIKSAPKQNETEAKKDAEPKFEPAKEVEKSVVDAKINAFLWEYFGVKFGDSIDKFPEEFESNAHITFNAGLTRKAPSRIIPVLKRFKYFDRAYGEFCEGKLIKVVFYVDIEEKYSVDSSREKIDKALDDLSVSFGLPSGAFYKPSSNSSASYEMSNMVRRPPISISRNRPMFPSRRLGATQVPPSANTDGAVSDKSHSSYPPQGFRRYEASIADLELEKRLEEERLQANREARRKANAKGETLPDPE